jgi:hypothetical protein
MKWIPYKNKKLRPKESGEYIVRYYEDRIRAVRNVCMLTYDISESGFMSEHNDYYDLEWLDESADEWISVEDELPIGHDNEDCVTDQVIVTVSYNKSTFVSTAYMKLNVWYWWESRKEMKTGFDITHWMPLPEAPKQ